MKTYLTTLDRRQSIVSTLGSVVMLAVMLFVLAACGGDGGGTTTSTTPITPTVAAPGMPENFTVVKTPETTLSANLAWSAPTSGGAVATYEIYRSTTAGVVFQPANHIATVDPSVFTYVDNKGLTAVDTYWVVAAKNAGGETPSEEVMFKPIGSPSGGGGDVGFGNNFSAALIFADNIGIGGAQITGTFTNTIASIDYNTGLRPLSTEVLPATQTDLPYFDPTSIYTIGTTDYYKQQTASTWQGEWAKGDGATQEVTAKWGDNLVSQSLSANSTIRVEMVLSKTLITPMTSYTMTSLYGAQRNEMQGTDGTTYGNTTALVFASNAHLKIEKLDDTGAVAYIAYDQRLWAGDGPGFLAAEISVSGNFTYGFVWNLKNQTMPTGIPKTGKWRLTFSLDPDNFLAGTSPGSIPYSAAHTAIIAATNGVLVQDPGEPKNNLVYIDITVQ